MKLLDAIVILVAFGIIKKVIDTLDIGARATGPSSVNIASASLIAKSAVLRILIIIAIIVNSLTIGGL
jgi:hypothetical protein